MSSYSVPIFHRPESESEISALVERLLYKAGAIDVIPTPIEGLIEAAGVFEVSSLPDPKSNFLSSLTKDARRVFKTAVQYYLICVFYHALRILIYRGRNHLVKRKRQRLIKYAN